MPADYEIRPGERLVLLRFHGHVTASDILDATSRLRADPAFEPGFATLVDCRDQISALSREELDRLMAGVAARPPGPPRRVAVVVGSDVLYGVTRMFQILAEDRLPHTIEVFRELDEAKAWLGVP